jgi:hypothetical protein
MAMDATLSALLLTTFRIKFPSKAVGRQLAAFSLYPLTFTLPSLPFALCLLNFDLLLTG